MPRTRLLLHITSILLLLIPFGLPELPIARAKGEPIPWISSIKLESPTQVPDYFSCGNQVAPISNWDYEQEVVELVNLERERVDYRLSRGLILWTRQQDTTLLTLPRMIISSTTPMTVWLGS